MSKDMKRAAAVTVGCRLNQTDTALMFGRLMNAGYEIVDADSEDPIDLIIINSCAVTASASQKSRQYARACRRKHPEATIVATGCDSQIEKSYWQNEKSVDVYVPNSEKNKLLKYIDGNLPSQVPEKAKVFQENTTGFYPFRSRAFIKIQEGCENFCTYCIVPYARGPERSRDSKEVFREFRNLLDNGHKEIVLTGVNISTYRDGSLGLSELLQELLAMDGDFRVRLSSTEPHPENKKLIGIMKDSNKLCRFLHLPLQHGSDEILKRMGRKYTSAEFADFANQAISAIPGLHLGTDVICGFPGETDELFEESCRFIESIPFANLHIFTFCPRKGTPAEDFDDYVHPKIMNARHRRLDAIEEVLAGRFLDSQVGKTLRILIEKVRRNGDCEGWSDNYIRMKFKFADAKANNFTDVIAKGKSGKILLG